ncbi:Carbamoyl-phosphate synthase large chain [Phycisphaerae bacterium RAS1]|nr:Carbamoyl-phosphate synthase large chain [Phycisphaerae bacterium RAS1]
MPRRPDIQCVLIIGSGPIVIGQACEFDYSGTQACKALREEGIRVVLVNSNPATIMTDPEFADRTYIEPITPEVVEKILAKEKSRGTPIDSILPTIGGQTGLNCAMACHQAGILQQYGVRMLAATPEAIHKAEDRLAFRAAMQKIGLDVPRSGVARSWEEAQRVIADVNLPCAIRPAFTLGGSGGGFARTMEEFEEVCKRGLAYSPVSQVLIEESLWGWKEFELEVVRDRNDNVVIVCSIENFDPMGVHTGDSITVAPAQTLSDREYQRMRDASIAIIREIGVDTGGSNIQFGVHPQTGRMCVIEMNPRVSRSSALASKATGFPIARIATKLAIGYTLDELPNDITKTTPACFEPAIDYCVVKIPRWTFEKFPEADEMLTTQMKSVGEAMAIGRTFKEALQKCIRSMELKRFGFGLDKNDRWLEALRNIQSRDRQGAIALAAGASPDPSRDRVGAVHPTRDREGVLHPSRDREGVVLSADAPSPASTDASQIAGSRIGEAPADTQESKAERWPIPTSLIEDKLARPAQGRLYYARYALKLGWSVDWVYNLSHIDRWFLENLRELTEFEEKLIAAAPAAASAAASAASAAAGEVAVSAFPNPPRQAAGCAPAVRAASDAKLAPLADLLWRAKSLGYSDVQLAHAWNLDAAAVRGLRNRLGVIPSYRLVDTCAAEFAAATPYYYSTYERPPARIANVEWRISIDAPAASIRHSPFDIRNFADEVRDSGKPKVVVLGGGPNRIGQGIEFDYCCVHAAMAARELGYDAVMINSNPETVSTDYDTSDMLFFEPLTHEDVLSVCETLADSSESRVASSELNATQSDDSLLATRYSALVGVICQFGGQTPLNLARGLEQAGVPILGTSPTAIHLAEDREQFSRILDELGIQQPPSGIARSFEDAKAVADRIGYPVLVRPSYVLGGRAMEICNNEGDLRHYMTHAVEAGGEHPILIDRFLSDAIEVDCDAVCDGRDVIICGVLEHIEEAGIHSGDSAMTLPPYSLSAAIVQQIMYAARRLALRLGVVGLMNVQFAIKEDDIYVLEVNPRASRTVPFIAKATGVPWAKIAAKVMLGKTLAELSVSEPPPRRHIAVKHSVFPFDKFPGVDVALGPEMRSTGEVMGVDERFSLAFAKAQMGASIRLPLEGRVFVSVADRDKPFLPAVARDLARLGFEIVATAGTARSLQSAGLKVTNVNKIRDGGVSPLDLIKRGEIAMLINTPERTGRHTDEGKIRAAAALHRLPIMTTITGAKAAVAAIGALKRRTWDVHALQDLCP